MYLAKHGNSKLKSGYSHTYILIFDLHMAFCFQQVLCVCLYRTSGLMTAHIVSMEMKETKHVSNHSYSDCSRIIVASSLYPLSHLLAWKLRNRSGTPEEMQEIIFRRDGIIAKKVRLSVWTQGTTWFPLDGFSRNLCLYGDRGGTVVKMLLYKSEGRWFDSRWFHWNFSFT